MSLLKLVLNFVFCTKGILAVKINKSFFKYGNYNKKLLDIQKNLLRNK